MPTRVVTQNGHRNVVGSSKSRLSSNGEQLRRTRADASERSLPIHHLKKSGLLVSGPPAAGGLAGGGVAAEPPASPKNAGLLVSF